MAECPTCKATAADNVNYCGSCGELLSSTMLGIRNALSADIKKQLESVLSDRFKDANVVEVEVTERIGKRMTEWARTFAFFAGIPVAALLLVLAVFGFKSYIDFENAVTRGIANVESSSKDASERLRNVDRKFLVVQSGTDKLLVQMQHAVRSQEMISVETLSESHKLTYEIRDLKRAISAMKK